MNALFLLLGTPLQLQEKGQERSVTVNVRGELRQSGVYNFLGDFNLTILIPSLI